jgi:hypothetical protein
LNGYVTSAARLNPRGEERASRERAACASLRHDQPRTIAPLWLHDAGCGRSMMHDAAGIGRIADHDAAGIGRSMIHDAAGCGRSMIHDAAGGLTPTPVLARHGPFMGSCHRRGIIGVMSVALCSNAAIIAHRSPQPFKTPQVDRSVGRFIRGGALAHPPSWIIHRPIPAAPWIIDRPIPAAPWIIDRPIPAAP